MSDSEDYNECCDESDQEVTDGSGDEEQSFEYTDSDNNDGGGGDDDEMDVAFFVSEHYLRFQNTVVGASRRQDIFEFMLFGSYPAHVKMTRLGMNPISYNDIDVMHQDGDFARFIVEEQTGVAHAARNQKSIKPDHPKFKAIQSVPYRDQMEIKYVCLSNENILQSQVHYADINAVKIGILVKFYCSACHLEMEWVDSQEFNLFLKRGVLAACNFSSLSKPNNALCTLVRLLYKAQQSKRKFNLPADKDIIRMCHGCTIGPPTVKKYESLQQKLKTKIDRLFFYTTETDKKFNTTLWRFFSRDASHDEINDGTLTSFPSCPLSVSDVVHSQTGGTCYANAIASAVRATEQRIVGRSPDSHEDIVNDIVARYGKNGGKTFQVLQEECAKRRLGCCRVELCNLVQVLQSNRTMVVTFNLSEDVWDAFSLFFGRHPKGILTMREIEKYKIDDHLPLQSEGHAVCALGLGKENGVPYIELKNSWGTSFGDNGQFKVGLDVVFSTQYNFKMYDVFFRICDLSPRDLQNFKVKQIARIGELRLLEQISGWISLLEMRD